MLPNSIDGPMLIEGVTDVHPRRPP